jgi:hypothetical protein
VQDFIGPAFFLPHHRFGASERILFEKQRYKTDSVTGFLFFAR